MDYHQPVIVHFYMGKTYKTEANYYRFKNIREDAPSHLTELIDVMDTNYKGYRFGKNRNEVAKAKKHGRKSRRMSEKHDKLTKWSNTLK